MSTTAEHPTSVPTQRAASDVTERPTSSARRGRRRRTAVGRVLRMTRFELMMIFRQKVALMSVLLAPATAIGIASFSKPADGTAWLVMLSSMSMLVLIMAVYTTTTSAVVSRRESQVFKRFRTSELLPKQMLLALAMPYVLVGLVQVAILTVAYQLMGAPELVNPGAFVGVILATTVLSVLAGFATASFTANSERVQFSVTPVMMIGLISSILVLNPAMSDNVRGLALLAPYASSSDLVARVLGAPDSTFATPGVVVDLSEQVGMSATDLMGGINVGLVVLWSLVLALLARKAWRWEPRG